MSVPTANILVTTNKESLEDILFKLSSGTRIKNLINELNDDSEVALFSNQTNPHFISFEHSFDQDNPLMTLEFLDPQGDFEQRYLTNRSVYDTLFTYIKTTNIGKQVKNAVDTKRQLEVRRSNLRVDKNGISEAIKNKLDAAFDDRYFYVAYGVGDNVKYWSNIHKVKLFTITYDMKATRKFTAQLSVIPYSLSKSRRTDSQGFSVDLETFGTDVRCQGLSQRLRFLEYLRDKSPIYGNSFGAVDYHQLICDVLRDFVRNATNGCNVIIALPDLNVLLGPTIKKINLPYTKRILSPGSAEIAVNKILTELKMEVIGQLTDRYTTLESIPDEIRGLCDQVRYSSNLIERNLGRLSERDFYASLSTKIGKGVPEIKQVLKEVFNNINKLSSSYELNFSLLVESDQNIIDYWAGTQGGGWTLNGYEPFDPESPTVILGDRNVISEVLFGQSNSPIPIHYLDKKLLLNETYKESISTVSKKKDLPSSYVLGNLYQVPDEFAYTDQDLIEKAKKDQKDFAAPVFKYNTTNPNVISIKDSFEPGVYFPLLAASFQKLRGELTKSISEGGVPVQVADFPITTSGALFDSLLLSKYYNNGCVSNREDVLEQIANNISTDIQFELYKKGAKKSMVDYLVALSNEQNRQLNGLTHLVPSYFDKAPVQLMTEFVQRMVTSARSVVIDTLPFFNISNTSYIHSPCMLFAQDAPVMGQPEVTRTGFNTYLTGAYKVMGYVHTIRAGSVRSKFTLVKPQLDIGEDEEGIITETSVTEKPDNVTQEERLVNSTPKPDPAKNAPAIDPTLEGVNFYTPPTQEENAKLYGLGEYQ
jgi:hypothetical protein